LVGAMAMSGFQGSSLKFANVDVEKVFNSSSLTKENQEQLQLYGSKRLDILRFLGANRAMMPSDTQTYADLMLMVKPSDSDTQRLASIVKAAQAESQKQSDLMQKSDKTLTSDDNRNLSDYHGRMQVNTDFTQKLEAKYDQEIRDEQTKLRNDALEKVRKTVGEMARKQGYSIVFSLDAAPFAQNNLTEEVTKEVNKS
jgi:Skp family chaperone for outer membrane proteins